MAIAPDSTWLATASRDCTVRIWDTTAWQPLTMTRLDSYATSAAWQGQATLALGGHAGLHLFDVLTSTNRETLGHTIC
jgi:WD40 repeat protein